MLNQQQLKLEKATIRHGLKSWITPKNKLNRILKLLPNKSLADPMKAGYLDIQLLCEQFIKATALSFGPSEPGAAHTANEFVKITNIRKSENFLIRILNDKILFT